MHVRPARSTGSSIACSRLLGSLYGITTLQMFIYFQNFFNDGRFLKGMVGTVW